MATRDALLYDTYEALAGDIKPAPDYVATSPTGAPLVNVATVEPVPVTATAPLPMPAPAPTAAPCGTCAHAKPADGIALGAPAAAVTTAGPAPATGTAAGSTAGPCRAGDVAAFLRDVPPWAWLIVAVVLLRGR